MSDSTKCPRCQTTLPPRTAPEACPTCLIRLGLEQTEPGLPTKTTQGDPARPAPQPSELEQDFPQLEILEVLGQGGMGVVYKARQKSLDRLVALKILSVPAEAGPDFAERFAREARALASLAHPSIVTVYDFGRARERYYLLMEYVDGANLHQLIHADEIRPRQALSIVSEVCEALQFAHEAGVVHRDIKPENILVDKSGRIKIADFGLAKMLGRGAEELRLTGAHQVMGTAHYMAPEQLEHPLDVDHRADIYSLGVVFYELLTGELPLGRFQPPSRKVALDVRVDEVVLKTLEKEPQLRYQAVSEVKTDVDGISRSFREGKVEKEASAARPRSAVPVWARWVFGTLLVLVLPAVLLSLRTTPESPPQFAGASAATMALVEAAGQGRTDGVLALLDSGLDVNAEGPGGSTALTQAADGGHAALVELLLARGADPDAPGPGSTSALIISAAQGRLDIVEPLLGAGAGPDLPGVGGTTALIQAIDGGHEQVIGALLSAEADPNLADSSGFRPIVLAASRGDVAAARPLVEAGADVNVRAPGGDTALILAVDSRRLELIRLFLDAGADPGAEGLGGRTALTVAVSSGSPEILEVFRRH